jgi:hypothetical protein
MLRAHASEGRLQTVVCMVETGFLATDDVDSNMKMGAIE